LPYDRDELLNRVYARATGLWWRRRVAPITAGVLVLTLAIGVPLLRAGGGGRGTTRLATAPHDATSSAPSGVAPGDPAGTTTTAPNAASHPSTTATTTSQVSGAHPTTTPATHPPGATTTTTTGACHNSHDPACGEFHWVNPGANAPISVGITFSPAHPVAGQTVTFTVHAVDPDATPVTDCGADYAGGGGGCAHTMECAINTGAWDPPPRQRGEATFSHQHAFAKGTYTVTFFVESAGGSKNNGQCGSQPNPYASDGQGSTTVVVS
jgi:hypothetical protein